MIDVKSPVLPANVMRFLVDEYREAGYEVDVGNGTSPY